MIYKIILSYEKWNFRQINSKFYTIFKLSSYYPNNGLSIQQARTIVILSNPEWASPSLGQGLLKCFGGSCLGLWTEGLDVIDCLFSDCSLY